MKNHLQFSTRKDLIKMNTQVLYKMMIETLLVFHIHKTVYIMIIIDSWSLGWE